MLNARAPAFSRHNVPELCISMSLSVVFARLDRAIQYSRESRDRAERPRRTGSPAFKAVTQRTVARSFRIHCEPPGRRKAPPDDRLHERNPSSRAKRRNGCFVARAPRNDVERDAVSRSRGMIYPRCFISSVPRKKREQGMPGARCTRGLVCKMHKEKRTRAYRFSGGSPAFPAQWLYGLCRALPGDEFVLSPSSAD